MSINNKNIAGIDFLKGLAILSVIFMHSVDGQWLNSIHQELYVGQSVPIFLSITLFLAFRKLSNTSSPIKEWFSRNHLWKTIRRVIVPFLIVSAIQVLVMLLLNRKELAIALLCSGGYGPGRYYIWIYVQLWVLAPFLYLIINRKRKWFGVFLILVISVILNVLCSIVNPERFGHIFWDYLCVRYVFLAAIAYIILYNDSFNKLCLLLLAIISFIYLEFFRSYKLEPWIYSPISWCTQNYPVYFYTLLVIVVLLSLHKWLSHYLNLNCIYWLGKNSWEIFLLQMAIIGFARLYNRPIDNHNWYYALANLCIAYTFSILPVYVSYRLKRREVNHIVKN